MLLSMIPTHSQPMGFSFSGAAILFVHRVLANGKSKSKLA